MDDAQETQHEETLIEQHLVEIPPTSVEERPVARFNVTFTRFTSLSRERVRVFRANFRLWRLRRPFWGSILMLLAGTLILWGPVTLMRFALLPGNSIWAGLLVGALLVMMGLIQLFAPHFALITGAIGIVLSLISLIVAAGGLMIGMLLGIIGSALGIAWKPNARPLPLKTQKVRQPLLSRIHLRKAGNISE